MAETLRLDLFLKNSGLVPRRPVAKRACDEGLVDINGRPAKASAQVCTGDTITLRIGMNVSQHEVLRIPQRAVAKAARSDYVTLLSTEKVDFGI